MTRFYDKLVNELRLRASLHHSQLSKLSHRQTNLQEMRVSDSQTLSILVDERCKRVLFDSRQAVTFDAIHDSPPEHWQSKLHPPFQWFYLELTEPVLIGEQEPGYTDMLRALLFRADAGIVSVKEHETVQVANLIVFLSGVGEDSFSDRGFLFHTQSGLALTRAGSARGLSDPSQIPVRFQREDWIFAGSGQGEEDRYVGWWERCISDYASMFSWMLVYMMAKGVKVIQEPVSRQQRRLYARKGIPLPWHIVRVEPRFQQGALEGEPAYHHRFRYDVMGHLRLGRHKLANGEYRENIEWVRDHQRGLANELYVPKTSKFEGGKVYHPTMGRYFPAQ